MHDGTISQGDTWPTTELPMSSSAYTSGTAAAFLTWDEGTGGRTSANCAGSTSAALLADTTATSSSGASASATPGQDATARWLAGFAVALATLALGIALGAVLRGRRARSS